MAPSTNHYVCCLSMLMLDGGNVMTLYAIVVVVDDQQRIRNSKMGNKHTQSEKMISLIIIHFISFSWCETLTRRQLVVVVAVAECLFCFVFPQATNQRNKNPVFFFFEMWLWNVCCAPTLFFFLNFKKIKKKFHHQVCISLLQFQFSLIRKKEIQISNWV